MDRLKKELERKKRALEQAKIGAAAVVKNTDGGGTASRFLNSSQLRRLQEQEEDRLKTSGKRPRNVIEGGLQQPSKSTDAKSGDFSVSRQRAPHSCPQIPRQRPKTLTMQVRE